MLDLSIIGAVIHLCHGRLAAIDTGVIAYVYQSVPVEYEAQYLPYRSEAYVPKLPSLL